MATREQTNLLSLLARSSCYSPSQLALATFINREADQHYSGAVFVDSRPDTGRNERQNFKVVTPQTAHTVDWGKINQPMPEDLFDRLQNKILYNLEEADHLYRFDGYVGADPENRINVTLFTPLAYQALFANHMFFPYTQAEAKAAELNGNNPKITVLCSPDTFKSEETRNTSEGKFIVSRYKNNGGTFLIGGTRYAGEIKKGLFTAANFFLPLKGVMSMHCSAVVGEDGETTLFFGLSGTGKTTLSAGEGMFLIGDDETIWSENGISNLEHGCYPKCIDLSRERESQIWDAIHKFGTLVENVPVKNGEFDFHDSSITENTRAAYPLQYIANALPPDIYPHPKHVVFLTYDASGVLPPVAKLNGPNAMYHFLSGYTSKVAGTVMGIKEPQPTFSHCFGAAFMPLPPMTYANLLNAYIQEYGTQVYLVNTGMQGGVYGKGGARMALKDTRRIVAAISNGQLDKATYHKHRLFNLAVPDEVAGINPSDLDPENRWIDKSVYNEEAVKLKESFEKNIDRLAGIPEEIKQVGP